MTPNPNPSPESVKLVASALCRAAGMDPEGGARTGYSWIDHEADACTLLAALSQTLPAPGEVSFPDIGPDPMKGDRADRIEQSVAVCREAYVKQQKGVPDQTALVWRWHLGALLECATRLKAILARDAPATVAAANDEGVARAIEAAANICLEVSGLIGAANGSSIDSALLEAARRIRLLSQGRGK